MANTQAIKKRMRSIASTQKITKAMKLVSLSKLQRYKERRGHFSDYYTAVTEATTKFIRFESDSNHKPKAYLLFMPDLGLCSAYTQGLIRALLATYQDDDIALVFGTQSYDLLKNRGVTIKNNPQSSEHIELSDILKSVTPYLETYEIIALIPEYESAMSLTFTTQTLKTKAVDRRDDVIYEPSYDAVAKMMIQQALIAFVRYAYLTSKVSEHTTRRIAMEKATDSAQDMIDDLGRRYNRVRQEAITQEISEIVSGMED